MQKNEPSATACLPGLETRQRGGALSSSSLFPPPLCTALRLNRSLRPSEEKQPTERGTSSSSSSSFSSLPPAAINNAMLAEGKGGRHCRPPV